MNDPLQQQVAAAATTILTTVYIYLDSKPLAQIVCLTEIVHTGLWAVWAEQRAPPTQFLPRPAKKESNIPSKAKK